LSWGFRRNSCTTCDGVSMHIVSQARLLLCQRGRKVWEPAYSILVCGIWNYFASRKWNANYMLSCSMSVYVYVLVEVCFTSSGCCETVSQQHVSSGYVCKRCFVLLDCRVRLKLEMEKAVFQVTASLNIRKDIVAETLPFSRGNGEGSSKKQLKLPCQHPTSQ